MWHLWLLSPLSPVTIHHQNRTHYCPAVMGILINQPFSSHPSPRLRDETQLCGRYNVWASVVASHNIVMRPIVHLKLTPLMSRVWWRGPGPLRGGAARLRGGCGRQQILRQLRPGTRGTETCTEECTSEVTAVQRIADSAGNSPHMTLARVQ